MFVAAAFTLSDLSPALHDPSAPLYPPLERVREASHKIALAVAMEAQRSGLAEQTSVEELERRVDERIWKPNYRRLPR
jgi:malate dehydrogenase (oxaloacetate-decarboxylating)